MASFNLKFSDPRKTDTIEIVGVDENGTGKNIIDTSLSLIGPGYVNYGLDTAQNFLKLLENFSGPHAPTNAIEGQLWYDTSNPNRKVLRINNGSNTSSRWPTVSGIYQQTTDPTQTYSSNIKDGDIWIDLTNSQLKIRRSDDWITVGPSYSSGDEKNGFEVQELVSSTDQTYSVIIGYLNGKVIQVISEFEFIPRSTIEGIPIIKKGVTLNNKIQAKYNGTAERSSALELGPNNLIQASEVLRNSVATTQTHIGSLIVQSINGLKIKRTSSSKEVIIKQDSTVGGTIYYDDVNGKLTLGIKDKSFVSFDGEFENIGVNTSTNALSPTFDVFGSGRFSQELTVNSLTALTTSTFNSDVSVDGDLDISGNLNLVGSTIVGGNILPDSNDVYDIGSPSNAFRQLHVSTIGTTGTNTTIYGSINGQIEYIGAPGDGPLKVSRDFSISGVITSTETIAFNGGSNVSFTTTVHRSLINDQPTTTTSITTSSNLLILDTSTSTTEIQKISKQNFLSDIYPFLTQTGMIVPYVGTESDVAAYNNPSTYVDWVIANGAEINKTLFLDLYTICLGRYGTPSDPISNFIVPNLTNVTSSTNGTYVIYLIKT